MKIGEGPNDEVQFDGIWDPRMRAGLEAIEA